MKITCKPGPQIIQILNQVQEFQCLSCAEGIAWALPLSINRICSIHFMSDSLNTGKKNENLQRIYGYKKGVQALKQITRCQLRESGSIVILSD